MQTPTVLVSCEKLTSRTSPKTMTQGHRRVHSHRKLSSNFSPVINRRYSDTTPWESPNLALPSAGSYPEQTPTRPTSTRPATSREWLGEQRERGGFTGRTGSQQFPVHH